MSILGRCIALSLAFIASTACPAMASAQTFSVADMEMGVATHTSVPHHEEVESPMPECCLGPMGAHGAQDSDGLIAPRVDGEGELVSIIALDDIWEMPPRDIVALFIDDPAPPPDFDRRSVMKRE